MLAPNTVLQNRYQIIRSIGRGGMGAVYLARDQRLGHTVALKETFFTEERMRRAFEREARLLASLRHPALPKVTDHFDEDGGQFIVMEFISGDDLEMLLAQRGRPFQLEQVLVWADELLKALDYLHRQDPPILHRDIKPANLKLTPQGEIILLDFGLAKGTAGQSSSVMTSRSVFGFTPNFAPLEQIQGTGTGPRSDLYSLAATIYYLVTGVIPPDALTRITDVANGQHDPLLRPDEVNAQIPTSVADVLMKTMAHNRDERPQSAAEMRKLLREASASLNLAGAIDERSAGGREARALTSTVIELRSTQDEPEAVETAAPATVAAVTAKSPTRLETDSPVIPLVAPARKANNLKWALSGLAALLLIGVTIALFVNYGAGTNTAQETSSSATTKDADLKSAETTKVSQHTVAAPDDSEIITTTDASGAEVKTRTFKSHARVSKVIVTSSNGQPAAKVYSHNGEARELPANKISVALEANGDDLADAAGLVRPTEKAKDDAPTQVASRKQASPKSTTERTTASSKTSGMKPAVSGEQADSSNAGDPNQAPSSKVNELKLPQYTNNMKQRGAIEKTGTPQKRALF